MLQTRVCTTEDRLHAIVEAYSQFDEYVFDVETRGVHRGRPERAEIAWIGLAGPGRTDVIPMGHINGRLLEQPKSTRVPLLDEQGEPLLTKLGRPRHKVVPSAPIFSPPPQQLWASTVFGELEPLFFSEQRKIGQGVKFDLTAVAKYLGGKVPSPPYGDTIVLHHLLDENLRAYNLEYLAKVRLKMAYSEGKLGHIGIDNFAFNTVAKYQHLDVKYTWMLWKRYIDKIAPQDLQDAFDLEMRVIEALIYMEAEGAPIDIQAMEDMRNRIDTKIDGIKHKLHKRAGKPWNVDAPAEKGSFVYQTLGHKVEAYTLKTGKPSTRADDLAKFASKDKYVALLVEYSQLHTLKATFLDGMYDKLVEGRLHPSFLQSGTTTGRFSCAAPNLQNIPRVTEGRVEFQIRELFIAPPGCKLIVADYSQIEYRLFAHYSKDPFMIEMFRQGVDAHAAMASLVLGIPPEKLTSEERVRFGKTLNFAIGFGAGPRRLAKQSKILVREAQDLLNRHEQRSPKFYSWKARVIRNARLKKPPQVRTYIGRKRRLPELLSDYEQIRLHAERQAINSTIQGTAADIMKLGMVDVHVAFAGTPVHPILTVHDELVTISPVEMVDESVRIIRKCMEGAVTDLLVPLLVDINVCERWSDGKN